MENCTVNSAVNLHVLIPFYNKQNLWLFKFPYSLSNHNQPPPPPCRIILKQVIMAYVQLVNNKLVYRLFFFFLAVPALSYSMRDPIPWPGIEPRLPALGVQSLSHWTHWWRPLLTGFWLIIFFHRCLVYMLLEKIFSVSHWISHRLCFLDSHSSFFFLIFIHLLYFISKYLKFLWPFHLEKHQLFFGFILVYPDIYFWGLDLSQHFLLCTFFGSSHFNSICHRI